MRAWTVARSNAAPFRVPFLHKPIRSDTVFFSDDMNAEDVKRALVNHDGYPADITVTED